MEAYRSLIGFVKPQNLDLGLEWPEAVWGRHQNDHLSKEADSEPACLIEACRGLQGFCEASETEFWSFWGGLGQTPKLPFLQGGQF